MPPESPHQPSPGTPIAATLLRIFIGDADRYTLLCAAGAGRRIELLDELLTDIEAVLQFRLGRD